MERKGEKVKRDGREEGRKRGNKERRDGMKEGNEGRE